MASSLYKILRYISCVSDFNGIVEYENEHAQFYKQKGIRISETFWHKDYCTCCGECCGNFNTIFSANEFETVKSMDDEPHKRAAELAVERKVIVDGQEFSYYEIPTLKSKDEPQIWNKRGTSIQCRFVDPQPDGKTKYCAIHLYRPISCGFPHMELRLNPKSPANMSSLRHIQYGRNHMLGCPVDLKKLEYDESTYNGNLYWLQRLNDFADEYHIPTFLPKVIDYIKTVDWQNPPKEDVIIYNKRTLL